MTCSDPATSAPLARLRIAASPLRSTLILNHSMPNIHTRVDYNDKLICFITFHIVGMASCEPHREKVFLGSKQLSK